MSPEYFSQTVDLIYAGVTNDHSLDLALQTTAAEFDCTSSALVYSDTAYPVADIVIAHGPFGEPAIRARYDAEYARDDPAPAAMMRLSVGEAAATDRLFDEAYRTTSRFILDFYNPIGLYEALGGPFVKSGGRVGIVAVHRGAQRPPFTSREIEHFGLLLQHFARAVDLRRNFFSLTATANALVTSVELALNAVMIFDVDGRLTHANTRARSVLERDDGLSLTRFGRLRVDDPLVSEAIKLRLEKPVATPQPEIWRVARRTGARPYVLRLTSAAQPPNQKHGTLLHLSDPDSTDPSEAGPFMEAALGLTKPAAALVAALIHGRDLNSYARDAGIALSTVKYHLQSAFTATGTTRQVDLVRLATAVQRDLGASGRR